MLLNTASQSIGAQMVTAADGTAFTGAVTIAVTIDSGTQATGTVGSGVCVHEGNGYHSYRPSQAETNGAHIAFTFTGTGAIPVTVQVFTRAGDAFTRLGAPAGASVSADVAAIDAKTTNLPTDPADQSLVIAATNALAALIGTPAGVSVSADIVAVKSDTAAILTDTGTTLDGKIDIIDTVVDAIKAKTDNLPSGIQRNTELPNFEFLMVLSSDHVSAGTGLTVTAQRSIDGAAFAACANAVAEVGSGVYKITFAAADLDGSIITFLFTAATADARVITIATEP